MPNEGFLDTRGKQWLAIGICARCKRKFPLEELWSDRNNPAPEVCANDIDDFDPYRIPANVADNIVLRHPRPDTPLS